MNEERMETENVERRKRIKKNTRTKIKDKIITKKRTRAKPQSIKSAGVS